MKVTLFILSAFVAISCARLLTEKHYQTTFVNFMHQHKKSYHHDEFQQRYRIFQDNLDFITTHNAKNNGVTLKMNHFGDLTNAEYRKLHLGLKKKLSAVPVFKETQNITAPASWDWREKGAVTPVKDQGQCGSCWSFSTTGSVEGCHFLAHNPLVGLSEQNLIDCSTAQGNEGCNGGLMTSAMDYIISNGGIDTEASYPYTATGPNQCKYSARHIGATLKSYVNVNPGDENDLLAKAAVGPVSVGIDASRGSFQFYSSGVYYDPDCSSTELDHGVLVVGWGTDSGTPYWLVKNSWSTSWGDDGYIKMARNRKNACGIASASTLPKC